MCDVLEEETALEDDAAAVLGPADHKNCSYMTGGQSTQSCIPSVVENTKSRQIGLGKLVLSVKKNAYTFSMISKGPSVRDNYYA